MIFPSYLNCDGKIVSETGPRTILHSYWSLTQEGQVNKDYKCSHRSNSKHSLHRNFGSLNFTEFFTIFSTLTEFIICHRYVTLIWLIPKMAILEQLEADNLRSRWFIYLSQFFHKILRPIQKSCRKIWGVPSIWEHNFVHVSTTAKRMAFKIKSLTRFAVVHPLKMYTSIPLPQVHLACS